jgi:hypothetical protein
MHRLPYRGVSAATPYGGLRARLARPWPAHAAPRSSPLFAQRPRSTWVSRRTARQVVKPNVEELRDPAKRASAGARDAGRPDPQLWCARTHTQAPAHRDACGRLTRSLRSCPTLRLPPPPRPPSQHSFGQLGPHRLSGSLGPGPHEQYLSDPWAPGHAVLCVWKPERRSFTHSKCHARLLSVRFFRSQS